MTASVKMFRPATYGFTIVELLVTIVIISILASVSVMGFNGITQRSKYSSTVSTIKSVERAFKLKAIDDGGFKPDSYYISCIGSNGLAQPGWNPAVYDILTYCSGDPNPLQNYLKASDLNYLTNGSGYIIFYDNDADTYSDPTCSMATFNAGVNLLFLADVNSVHYQIPADSFSKLDTELDSSSGLNCGAVRYNGQQYYTLSPSSAI